ncbi:MAG: MBG domain-containing protein, partial [Comamonadaceae bacterium]
TVTGNSDTSKVYTGLAQSVSGFTATGLVNNEAATVLRGVSASGSGTNAGSYAVAPTGTDANYTLTFVNGNLVIGKAAATVTASAASKTYDGLAYTGGNGVSYSGLVNGETSAVLSGTLGYAGTSQGAKDAGSYLITPNGLSSGNYSIAYVDGKLTVNKASLTVTALDDSKTYDATPYTGGKGATYVGLVNGQTPVVLGGTLIYGGSARGAASAGSYVITLSGLDPKNYRVSYVDGQLIIMPAPPVITVTSTTPPAPDTTPFADTGGGQGTGGNTGSRGVTVSLDPTGVVSVMVPREIATGASDFSFQLPEQITQDVPVGDVIQVKTIGGDALPAWLKFVPESNTFVSSAVPQGALPMEVVVTFGGKRSIVVISERESGSCAPAATQC